MMAYSLKKMVESIQFLVSGRIHKINQPENDTILMVIRQNRKNHQLLQKNMIIHLNHQCLLVFLESI